MAKSYSVTYKGDIEKGLMDNNINDYIVLNEELAVLYVDDDFNERLLETIDNITWWQIAQPMSSLIQLSQGVSGGETVSSAAGTSYIDNNPFINPNGKGVIIAIIDSGIDYLHPDFIDSNNNSRIISIWDQNESTNPSPEGMSFGSEFTREDLNNAIRNNNDSLSKDYTGTGTFAAGVAAGNGDLNSLYRGVATGSELVVVKLREYKDTYLDGKTNYLNTDFLAGIKYVLDVAKKENKLLIINLTVAERSRSVILTNLLDTFNELRNTGIVVVSGSGNEGNTNIHYEGVFKDVSETLDVIIEVAEQNMLDIILIPNGPSIINIEVISPSGEVSYNVSYSPDDQVYTGQFNLENSPYEIRITYPWLLSGNQEGYIRINDIKPGIWTLRLTPQFITTGEFDIYLPNANLISPNTRFLDPESFSTITLYGMTENVITVGAYNGKTDSMWIGSSKGPVKESTTIKPDIVAPGVDIISTFINQNYIKATGTGVSSSLTSGVLALIMEYISQQGMYQRKVLFTEVIKTYLMLGATRSSIYTYPNNSEGYGVLNLQGTIEAIANNI